MSARHFLIQAGTGSHHGPIGARQHPASNCSTLQPSFHEHQEEMMKASTTIPSAIRRQFLEMAIRVVVVGVGHLISANLRSAVWIVLGVRALYCSCMRQCCQLLIASLDAHPRRCRCASRWVHPEAA